MQSIYLRTIDSIKSDYQNDLVNQAYVFYLKSAYSVGEGVCKEKRNHLIMALSFMENKNCDVIRNLNSSIKGCNIETEDNMCKTLSNLNGKEHKEDEGFNFEECEEFCYWEVKEW